MGPSQEHSEPIYDRKGDPQAGGRVAKRSLQEERTPPGPQSPLGTGATEASQKAATYGKATPIGD